VFLHVVPRGLGHGIVLHDEEGRRTKREGRRKEEERRTKKDEE
jgi:hypothetical protein